MYSKSALHIILSAAMALMVPYSQDVWAGKCEAQAKKYEDDCTSAVSKTAGITNANTPSAEGVTSAPAQGNMLTSTATANMTALSSAITQCKNDLNQCKSITDPNCSDDQQACTKSVNDNIANLTSSYGQNALAAQGGQATATPSSASPGTNSTGSGGMGSMMSMIAPLAMVGAMAAMMMNQQQPATTATPTTTDTSTLQPDGSLNCSMSDSYQFPGCDSYNASACAVQAVSTTTTATTAAVTTLPTTTVDCSDFTNRYCSTSVTGSTTYADTLASGTVTEVNIGGTGEGLGTPFCQQAVAAAYCSNPTYATARAQCPSCLNLSSSMSATCAANPSACLAQNSSTLLASASSTCPDDPIFSNPSNSYVGTAATGTTAATATTTTVTTQNVPTNGTSAAAASGNGTIGVSTVTTMHANTGGSMSSIAGSAAKSVSAASRTPATSSPSAVKAVAAKAATSSATAAMASAPTASATPTATSLPEAAAQDAAVAATEDVMKGAAAADIARAVALATNIKTQGMNSIAGIKTASAAAGPASDVAGAFGPSLFSTSSSAIRSLCQEGKINNCP